MSLALDTGVVVRAIGLGDTGFEVSLGDLGLSWRDIEVRSYDFVAKHWTWSRISSFSHQGERSVWKSWTAGDKRWFFHTGDQWAWWCRRRDELPGVTDDLTIVAAPFRDLADRNDWRPVVDPCSEGARGNTDDPNLATGFIMTAPDIDLREVAGITVFGTHNFVLFNGLLVRNCGDSR